VSELRQDPTTLGWVLVAPERSRRPDDHASADRPRSLGADACPLCPGHESETPPEVWRLGSKDGNWRVRVVPNRFPLLRPAEDPPALRDGFRSIAGRG
jgi:UDPglucose--hexose-1-phosphate uridylyltransferase